MRSPPDADSLRMRWRRLPPVPAPQQWRSRSETLCSDPRTLTLPCIAMYQEGSLRALVQVTDVQLEDSQLAVLTLKVLAQACPPSRPLRSLRPELVVTARLPDGMYLIWRLWTLTAQSVEEACTEAVERRLVNTTWVWWAPASPS